MNYLRIAPRKVRLVANVVRGKSVPEAERLLRFASRGAARPLAKLLKSAVANARHNFQVADENALKISEIRVDGGPVLKRRSPRAMGRAFLIRKRTSHVHLVLEAHMPAAKPTHRRAETVAVVGDADTRGEELTPKEGQEREVFRTRTKAIKKPTDFVQRMFRRKVI